MALIKCKECGKDVSSEAKACPHCGANVPHTGLFTKIVIGFLIFAGISVVWGMIARQQEQEETAAKQATREAAQREGEKKRLAAMTPEQRSAEEKKVQEARQEAEKTRRQAEEKRLAAKKKDDERMQRAVFGAAALKKSMREPDSFQLESALVIEATGAVCYEYRAKNGFGGVNVGAAVITGDSKQFRVKEKDGNAFVSLWNRECANKPGSEVAAGIRSYAL